MGCGASAPQLPVVKKDAPLVITPPSASSTQACDGSPADSASRNVHDGSAPPRAKRALSRPTGKLEDHYEIGARIGFGAYGVVSKCTSHATGTAYAVKSVAKSRTSVSDLASIRTEIQVLYHLAPHESITRIRQVFEDDTHIHVVMDLCEGGELCKRLAAGHFTQRSAAHVLRRLLKNILLLEPVKNIRTLLLTASTAIAPEGASGGRTRASPAPHPTTTGSLPPRTGPPAGAVITSAPLDPKAVAAAAADGPTNTESSPPERAATAPAAPFPQFEIQVADFGLSAFIAPGQLLTEPVGTPYFVAPEVLRGSYGPPADVWSCGAVLYMLLCGEVPFPGDKPVDVFKAVLHTPLRFTGRAWRHVSAAGKQLLSQLMDKKPGRRITALAALQHPWLAESGADAAPDLGLEDEVLQRLRAHSARSRFQRLAALTITTLLSEEEVAGLRALFRAMDTANEGCITVGHIRERLGEDRQLHASRLGRVATEHIRELLGHLDPSGEYKISCDEFVAATMHATKLISDDAMRAAFNAMDRDRHGSISEEELRLALRDAGMQADDGAVRKILVEADVDGDGKISFPEYRKAMLEGFSMRTLLVAGVAKGEDLPRPRGLLNIGSLAALDEGTGTGVEDAGESTHGKVSFAAEDSVRHMAPEPPPLREPQLKLLRQVRALPSDGSSMRLVGAGGASGQSTPKATTPRGGGGTPLRPALKQGSEPLMGRERSPIKSHAPTVGFGVEPAEAGEGDRAVLSVPGSTASSGESLGVLPPAVSFARGGPLSAEDVMAATAAALTDGGGGAVS